MNVVPVLVLSGAVPPPRGTGGGPNRSRQWSPPLRPGTRRPGAPTRPARREAGGGTGGSGSIGSRASRVDRGWGGGGPSNADAPSVAPGPSPGSAIAATGRGAPESGGPTDPGTAGWSPPRPTGDRRPEVGRRRAKRAVTGGATDRRRPSGNWRRDPVAPLGGRGPRPEPEPGACGPGYPTTRVPTMPAAAWPGRLQTTS